MKIKKLKTLSAKNAQLFTVIDFQQFQSIEKITSPLTLYLTWDTTRLFEACGVSPQPRASTKGGVARLIPGKYPG
jgi:hypothetical protein